MKIQIQKLKSSKLFYNKWPYKIKCIHRGASKITHTPVPFLKAWCSGSYSSKMLEDHIIDKASLLEFIKAVEPFLDRKEDVQIRAENEHFNLFCKDPLVLEEINNALGQWIEEINGPTTEEEYQFLISNGHKKILRDVLPKGKYQYKIYFKNQWPKDKREAFYSWLDKFSDKIEISYTSKLWIEGKKLYVQDPFMYVVDAKMLSMIGIFISGYVKKVEEFILRENVLAA